MTDRAQLASTPLPVVLAVVLLVGAIIFNEVQTQLAAADGVVNTCGLCHVDWRAAIAWVFVTAPLAVLIMSWLRSREWQIRAAGDSDE